MADEKDNEGGVTVENLQQQIRLNNEKLQQAEKLKLSAREINELKVKEFELRNQILEAKSNDLSLTKEERDQARQKLEDRKKDLKLQKDITAELDEQTKAHDRLNDRYKDTIQYIDAMTNGWKDGFTGQIVSSFKNLDKIGKSLKENLTFKNVAGSLAETVLQSTMAAVYAADGARAGMAKVTGQGHELNGVMDDVASSNRSFGVSFAESAAALTALSSGMSGFNSMSKETQAQLGSTVAKLGNLGVSADTATANIEIGRKVMGLTAQGAADMQNDMARLAVGIGEPASKLADSFKAAAPQLAAHGGAMVGIFENLAKTAKKTGVEISELLGITAQFDTFEGAANAAGKLNSILGGDVLNSTELMLASEDERLDMIRRSIAASGQSFDSMSRFQKMAVANAAGIKDMTTATKLFSEQSLAATENTDLFAVSQETLEERQKAAVTFQQKGAQVMNAFAVAVMPLVKTIHALLNVVLGINDAFGGYLIPVIVGAAAAAYVLKGAIAAKNAVMSYNATLTATSTAGKIKETAANTWSNFVTWLGVKAKVADTAATDNNTRSNISNAASEQAETLAKGTSTAASLTKQGATNAETLATGRLTMAQRAGALLERGWAATKVTFAAVTNAIATALGLQTAAATASLPANTAAAVGEVELGAGASFAVVPVGLLALAIALAAIAVSLFAIAVVAMLYIMLEFIKWLVEAPERILYAVAAFAVLAIGISLVAFAMQFLGIAVMFMAFSLIIAVYAMQTLIPVMPTFLAICFLLAAGVMVLAFAFGWLALSMVAIAVSMASMVKSTKDMTTGSGLLEFRSAMSGMVDELDKLEEVLGIMVKFASVSSVMSIAFSAVASSLVIMSFGLGLVAVQMRAMAESFETLEGVNASFEQTIVAVQGLTPDSVENVVKLVNEAERYTESQIKLKGGIVEGFVDAITNAVNTVTGGAAGGAGAGDQRPIILKLDEREFGRAVGKVVDGKVGMKP